MCCNFVPVSLRPGMLIFVDVNVFPKHVVVITIRFFFDVFISNVFCVENHICTVVSCSQCLRRHCLAVGAV